MKKEKSFMDILIEGAVETGEIEGHEYFIMPSPTENALNGYVIFNKRPVKEPEYDGILSYVPVHGGITLAREQKDGKMIYGFDTVHYNSHEFQRTDKEWIKEQIQIMLKGIQVAATIETKYMKCVTNKGKARYAQMVQDVQPGQELGFGAMINLLSGQL